MKLPALVRVNWPDLGLSVLHKILRLLAKMISVIKHLHRRRIFVAGPAVKQFCKRNLPISGTQCTNCTLFFSFVLRIRKQRDVESSNIPLKKHDACTQTDSKLELMNYKNFVIILYKLGKKKEKWMLKSESEMLALVMGVFTLKKMTKIQRAKETIDLLSLYLPERRPFKIDDSGWM